MSESTASRIDRVGREQRREERQRTSTSGSSASSNMVSSTSFTSSSSPNQSPIAPKSGSQNEHQMSCTNEDNNGEDPDSTSTFEQGISDTLICLLKSNYILFHPIHLNSFLTYYREYRGSRVS